jgi:hypothetical protein
MHCLEIQVTFVLKAAMEDEEIVDTFKAAFQETPEGLCVKFLTTAATAMTVL